MPELVLAPGWRRFGAGLSLGLAFFGLGFAGQPAPQQWPAPGGLAKPVSVPVNQVLTPAGHQVELPGLRPQVIALSPDGRLLVTSGKTPELVVINPVNGAILQRVPLPAEDANSTNSPSVSSHLLNPDRKGQVSYTGLVFSPDGRRLYLSNVNGSIKVFSVESDLMVRSWHSLPLPETGLAQRTEEIPAGLALSRDGRLLYVALNLSNRLLELDLQTGQQRLFDVGVAPYGVGLVGGKAYVSNWGGRRPDSLSTTGPAGRGTRVRVDPVRHIASEGSVSVIDLAKGQVTREILVGLHPSALWTARDGHYVLVACAASDTVSVIATDTDEVAESISLRGNQAGLFGANPNDLAMDPEGKYLYVCNGTQNAVAIVAFQPGASRLCGLIPTGWFPGAIAYDAARRSIYVANLKGVGSGLLDKDVNTVKYNSRQHFGTLSLIPLPDSRQLRRFTRAVLVNGRQSAIAAAQLPARPNRKPRPVPERAGEPSVFRHVLYIIKENRTYDQVLGDMPEGRGDPNLCVFGEKITPNQHRLAREFVLLDGTCCSGILSADGHQWSDSAMATEYLEKSFAGFPRSYPDGMEDTDVDALAYSPAGFLWDSALAHGLTLRDYGEFTIGSAGWSDPRRPGQPQFLDYYRDFLQGTGLTRISCQPAIESLRPHICTNTIGWDMAVSDQFRAAQFIQDLRAFEQQGHCPSLLMICLPNDHTSGVKAGQPTPAAQVADNDLALGRIVEAVSHSSFWRETCIFVIEDDPQDGWDHLSAYRTTAYVISPYTHRRAVVHTPYNQTSLLRTMELILGLPPLNQMDAAATPMWDCFVTQPNFTPYHAVPNNVPLDQLNPPPSDVREGLLREHALASASLPLDQVDQCPEDLLNRILWHAQKGAQNPYPVWATRGALRQAK